MSDDKRDALEKPKGIVLATQPGWTQEEVVHQEAASPSPPTSQEVSLQKYEHAPVYLLECQARGASLERFGNAFARGLSVVDRDGEARLLVCIFDGFATFRAAADQERVLRLARSLAACKVPVLSILKGAVGTSGLVLTLCSDVVLVSPDAQLRFDAAAMVPAMSEEQLRALLTPWLGPEAADTWVVRGLSVRGAELTVPGVEVLPEPAMSAALESLVNGIIQGEIDALRLLKRHLSQDLVACLEGDLRSHAVYRQRPKPRGVGAPEEDETAFRALPFASSVVSLRHDGEGVLILSMHDRDSKNAFSESLVSGLLQAFEFVEASFRFKVVILTGYDQYFASGGTKDVLHKIQAGLATYQDVPVYDVALRCRVPVIAAMQGHGIGVGWTLGLYSDLPIFSEESVYACSMMKYGFTPGAGSTFVFPYRLGSDLGREAQYTAREYRGSDLKKRHVGYPVLPRKSVLPSAIGVARSLCRSTREQLMEAKAKETHLLLRHMEAVHAQELAMHDKTFRGSASVLARIDASYGTGGAARPESPMAAPRPRDQESSVAAPQPRDQESPVAKGRPPAAQAPERRAEADADVQQRLRVMLAEELYLSVDDIDEGVGFSDLGVDSIIGVTWIRRINATFGLSIAATKIYNYPTLRDFAWHVQEELRSTSGASQQADPEPVASHAEAAPAPAQAAAAPVPVEAAKPQPATLETSRGNGLERAAIAIVGMAGRYPKAANADELWEVVREARDCVDLIPPERWRLEDYYDERPATPGKTYCKWMGAIDDIDRFDPLFFNISPSDAEYMDPQQRLFLEHAWACLEDAGYAPEVLSGSRCGVFVGCSIGDYGDRDTERRGDFQRLMGGSTSILAARIAYHLNLQGPCLAIDTACSSSLVAIAEACNSLVLGDSDLALAGGVTTLIGPTMHTMTSQAGMLSRDGRCFAFDDRANGFVPSEGVGVLLLKRLRDAENDGDPIYGVLRGWGVNQDGKTHGITAPNQDSQARLERMVYERSGINPAELQLVEAHGTGTQLGDPIEVEALVQSFRHFTDEQRFCALGSIKSNIGHSIAASGVAGVMKVLLAMKHRILPPTIHFEKPNEHLRLEGSPFYINTECRDWRVEAGKTRKAAVSSFGISGTNAHVLIEEYPAPARRYDAAAEGRPAMFVLSARSEERLTAYAAALLRFVEGGLDRPAATVDLHALAYTFQTGRAAFEVRLGIVCESLDDLRRKLRGFLDGEAARGATFSGQALRRNPSTLRELSALAARGERALANGQHTEALELWVKGAELDWHRLYGPGGLRRPIRVHAPTYPFARERYWLASPAQPRAKAAPRGASPSVLHPLVHRNTSVLTEQRYQSTFTGAEWFLEDHVVQGQKLLPGAAYLEMIAAAFAMASGRAPGDIAGLCIADVLWLRPFTAGERARDIDIALLDRGAGELAVEVSSLEAGERTIHCHAAVLEAGRDAAMASVDLERLQKACNKARIDGADCYAAFLAAGLQYGAGHRVLDHLLVGSGQVLAKLRAHEPADGSLGAHALHPGLLDGAFQASLGLMVDTQALLSRNFSGIDLALPFALDRVEVRERCTRDMWAWVRLSDAAGETGRDAGGGALERLAIDLLNDRGELCCRLRGLTSRPVAAADKPSGTITLAAEWAPRSMDTAPAAPAAGTRVLFTTHERWLESWRRQEHSYQGIHLLAPVGVAPADRFMGHARQALESVKELLRAQPSHPILVQVVCRHESEGPGLEGLVGLFRSAHLENPALMGQVVVADDALAPASLLANLEREAGHTGASLVRYAGGRRELLAWREIPRGGAAPMPWRHRGVYLLSGGLGGLGRCFARAIAGAAQGAKLVLAGRSPLDGGRRQLLDELRLHGAEVDYAEVDVGDAGAVEALAKRVVQRYGALHGVIHGAGLIRDSFILKKTPEELAAVLGPKVAGTLNLDAATRALELDFFVLFSSLASVLGNVGQADYATGNAFMDQFAHHRNELVKQGRRHGHTLSINWPLWRGGGMGVSAETAAMMKARMGMEPLPEERGVEAFAEGLSGRHGQLLVVSGNVGRLRAFLQAELIAPASSRGQSQGAAAPAAAGSPAAVDDASLRQVIARLKQVMARELDLPAERIDEDAPFEDYGIDSIKVISLTTDLERDFGALAKTLFFEYRSTKELAAHLLRTKGEAVRRLVGQSDGDAARAPAAPPSHGGAERPAPAGGSRRPLRQVEGAARAAVARETDQDIAIIGMAGRYPGARDLEEFWSNLENGKDSITEVPAERWDWQDYYTEDRSLPGHHYSKWGGFIQDADKFDALFFNISPREAEIMDPQERLFLEHAWAAVEDAGYTRKTLKEIHGGEVGVYAAAMYNEYPLFGAEASLRGPRMGVAGTPASIANRVSYVLDLRGPSMAVDSMCSGSLTSVHLACRDLKQGVIDLAIAGGVNLSLHPNKYLALSGAQFISSEGRCASFGEGGSGYVPGEGVGVLILKRLSDAERDGDTILGVIKGAAVNHGGRTSGYTVPSPNAQTAVIQKALAQAGVEAKTITCLEAHGTGTKLGDPIEIASLVKAFGESPGRPRCYIGSVKSNIGHCESAAGVAGLTKLLLQLQHRKLVPSLHSRTLNPFLDFGSSAFVVNQTLRDWDAPVIEGKAYPRRAGVSSFGAGGANAHVILEEYGPRRRPRPESAEQRPAMLVLSAKTEERLEAQARNLLRFLVRHREAGQPPSLEQVAYTLQVGREPMSSRLGLLASSLAELEAKLERFVAGKTDEEGVFTGQVETKAQGLHKILSDSDHALLVETWLARRDYPKILQVWVRGVNIDWGTLYRTGKPGRVRLPSYPFARERHWLPTAARATFGEALHPLIDRNTSTLTKQRFTKRLRQQELVLRDHRVQDLYILPGVAHLEMALAAGSLSTERSLRVVRSVTWGAPLVLDQAHLDVQIDLSPPRSQGAPNPSGTTGDGVHSGPSGLVDAGAAAGGEDDIDFVIYGERGSETVVYSRGTIDARPARRGEDEPGPLDLGAVRARCHGTKTKEEIDRVFAELGFGYGPSFQVIEVLYLGDGEALGEIALPEHLLPELGTYTLHPSLLDAAIRTSLGLVAATALGGALRVPFSLDEVRVLKPLTARCHVHATARSSGGGTERSYDFDLVDEAGERLVQIRGLLVRPLQSQAKEAALCYRPVWRERPLAAFERPDLGRVLVFDNEDERFRAIQERLLPGAVQVKKGLAYQRMGERRFVVRGEEPASFRQLFAHLSETGPAVAGFLYLWSLDAGGAPGEDLLRLLPVVQGLTDREQPRPVRGLYVYRSGSGIEEAGRESVAALAKSLTAVNHLFALTSVRVDDAIALVETIAAELCAPSVARPREVKYEGGRRYERGFEAWRPEGAPSVAILPRGVHLITGGAGGLGLLFARHLAETHQAKVVLLGRSELTEARAAQLGLLQRSGAEVHYERCDVTKRESLSAALSRTRERFGRLDGVLHSAGLEGRVPILTATTDDFSRVLSPKIEGTLLLDELTRDDALSVFVLFSSLSAQVGDFGVGAYAAANRFLDGFAAHRETLRRAGKRHGKTLALDWPLWEEGGFKADEAAATESTLLLHRRSGLTPMKTATGLEVFERALGSDAHQVIVAHGVPAKVERLFSSDDVAKRETSGVSRRAKPDEEAGGGEAIVEYLKEKLAAVSKVPSSAIDPHAELEVYGIDSIMIMELNRLLGKDFRDLPGTLLFECRTIHELAKYLVENHPDRVDALFARGAPAAPPATSREGAPTASRLSTGVRPWVEAPAPARAVERDDIAIIGVSGRYPKADNLEELWENLAAGVDAIEEVPPERWEITRYYDKERKPGRTYSKWGGFIAEADQFDALFFNMAPVQATQADPQLRLMLMAAWETIEDAGYTKANLCKDPARKVGVFVGVMWNEYPLLCEDESPPLANNFSLANQISYHFDFHGPSLVIDTACSSSLYAIALACESIKRGESELSLAGGVNLSLHPSKYVGLSQMGFLSSDGRCRSFGSGGNGYVPGEGVGCVLLKPLRKAEEDGDQILGVVRASVMNHGGKTNGATVPNPHAQAELVSRALAEAALSPEEITYIEAHGTGTELGDPIEIRALTKAFGGRADGPRCAIGSIKSNLGHLEGAAGIAAVTKVLLQLKHRQLAPSLHAETLNPLIDFERSPFAVQRALGAWRRPLVRKGGGAVEGPRIAGISSFGAGGANAHLIIAEHAVQPGNARQGDEPVKVLVVLSARSRERLVVYAAQVLQHIRRHAPPLSDLAYTLQVGREAMDERLAIVTSSREQLEERLGRFLNGQPEGEGVFTGRLGMENGRLPSKTPPPELMRSIEAWAASEQLDKLAELWTQGYEIGWERLVAGRGRRRISLPTYPFAKKRYWHGKPARKEEPVSVLAESRRVDWLYLKEEWVERALPRVADWNARLERYAGKSIVLVAAAEQETARLAALLREVEAAGRPSRPLRVRQVAAESLGAAAFKEQAPDVVLFLGPTREQTLRSAWEPREIRAVFRLSQALMQAAWEKDIEIYYLFEGAPEQRRIDCEALCGLLGSAVKENEHHVWRTIAHYDPELGADRYQVLLTEWLGGASSKRPVQLLSEARTQRGKRFEKAVVETSLPAAPADPFKMHGSYLIAGGMGTIGERLCERLAERYQANLYIMTRGALTEPRRELCDRLRRLGGNVRYLSVDLVDSEATREAYRTLKKEARSLDGVIHLARAHESMGIATKSEESFERVSQVKVQSTYHLDRLTAEEPLDFFMVFSSLGAHGARGDCDYAYSAAYQSVFAGYRNQLRSAGKRSGRTITQCWGPWAHDRLFPESRERMKAFGFGLIDMDGAWGPIAASVCCEQDAISLMLVADRERVQGGFVRAVQVDAEREATASERILDRLDRWEEDKRRGKAIAAIVAEVEPCLGADGIGALDEAVLDRLNRLLDEGAEEAEPAATSADAAPTIRGILAEVLELQEIDDEQSFQNYGVDSILAMKISTRIEKALSKEVKPQWLLEHPTVRALAQHLTNGKVGEERP